MKTFNIPLHNINMVINVDNGNGTIESDLHDADDSPEVKAAFDAVESLTLACACAGIDVETPQFSEALQTALAAITENLGE